MASDNKSRILLIEQRFDDFEKNTSEKFKDLKSDVKEIKNTVNEIKEIITKGDGKIARNWMVIEDCSDKIKNHDKEHKENNWKFATFTVSICVLITGVIGLIMNLLLK